MAKMDETENSLRFRQFPPSQCVEGSFRALTRDVPKCITLVACGRRAAESADTITEAVPPNDDGTCPATYPVKRRDPETGRAMCFKQSESYGATESLATRPDGCLHPHPHDADGVHDHPGLPNATGGHGHGDDSPGGGHTHRPGDPVEGWHPNQGHGSHIHALAAGILTPEELERYLQVMVDVHFPRHAWLPDVESIRIRHVRYNEATEQYDVVEDWRPSTADDWRTHALWSLHLPKMNAAAHVAVFLDDRYRILEKMYVLADGTTRPPTPEDFEKETAFFSDLEEKEPLLESMRQRADVLCMADENSRRISEAFHIRDIHWVPAGDDGGCPVNFPVRLKTKSGAERCYTRRAARAASDARAVESVIPSKNDGEEWANAAARWITASHHVRDWSSMGADARIAAWERGLVEFSESVKPERDDEMAAAEEWFKMRGLTYGVYAARRIAKAQSGN